MAKKPKLMGEDSVNLQSCPTIISSCSGKDSFNIYAANLAVENGTPFLVAWISFIDGKLTIEKGMPEELGLSINDDGRIELYFV